jgi:3-hydroxybutyryl-CoA dehydratase
MDNHVHPAPGDNLPVLRKTITQELVDLYAEASGDHNPLHIEPAFAAQTRFGRTVAHGQLTLAIVSQAITRWAWSSYAHGGGLDSAFLGPVFPGDQVVVTGQVTAVDETDEGAVAVCDISARVGERRVLAATARLPLNGGE